MAIMNRARFRTLAELSKTTWEGGTIKAVQTALDKYHKALPASLLQINGLRNAIDNWYASHAEPTKARSRAKRRAMDLLRDQFEAQYGNWAITAAPLLAANLGTCYRRSLSQANLNKDPLQIPQFLTSKSGVTQLTFADARQTPRKDNIRVSDLPVQKANLGIGRLPNDVIPVRGPDRIRLANLLTRQVIDNWEGGRVGNATHADLLLARTAVRTVRKIMRYGPSNNQPRAPYNVINYNIPAVPGVAQRVLNRGHAFDLIESISMHLVQEETGRTNNEPTPLYAYACDAAAARVVGGGVCAHQMEVTAGVLTTLAPANTEILLWYSGSDHQFCVISVAQREWIIVDPWPYSSYTTHWGDACWFPPPRGTRLDRYDAAIAHHGKLPRPWQSDGVEENYAKITVQNTCRIPFGIPGLLTRAEELLEDFLQNGIPDPNNPNQRLLAALAQPGLAVNDWGHGETLNPNFACTNGHNCGLTGKIAMTGLHMDIPYMEAANGNEYGDDCDI